MAATGTHIKYLHTGALPIFVGFTADEQAFNREMKRLNVKNPRAFITSGANGTTHILEKDGAVTAIVCVKPKRGITKGEMAGLLVHEAVHCWQETRKVMREDEPSPEFEAYTIQYFAQWLMGEMESHGKSR